MRSARNSGATCALGLGPTDRLLDFQVPSSLSSCTVFPKNLAKLEKQDQASQGKTEMVSRAGINSKLPGTMTGRNLPIVITVSLIT